MKALWVTVGWPKLGEIWMPFLPAQQAGEGELFISTLKSSTGQLGQVAAWARTGRSCF